LSPEESFLNFELFDNKVLVPSYEKLEILFVLVPYSSNQLFTVIGVSIFKEELLTASTSSLKDYFFVNTS
tara:strand:+ start:379 stop:588 length:210 start_codon:yes stop_codon:yes gene_type:complete